MGLNGPVAVCRRCPNPKPAVVRLYRIKSNPHPALVRALALAFAHALAPALPVPCVDKIRSVR
eukprot:scaffold59477_cov61-Phaeocystis_antarctica.AAC.2